MAITRVPFVKVTCRFCGQEFESRIVDGSIQSTDAAGLICCDECYDWTTGYGKEVTPNG